MDNSSQKNSKPQTQLNSIDMDEVKKFEELAKEWWNPGGKFKALHKFNPARLTFIRNEICNYFNCRQDTSQPLIGISVLDIGCGGGLIAEPMTRLGAKVTGIDASSLAIEVARSHASDMGLDITYRGGTVDSAIEKGSKFDVVLNLEVIEHVSDAKVFLRSAAPLVGPRGMMVTATLNRTLKSFILAIMGAEYVLGWLPRGTHDWNRFVRPSELASMLRESGLFPNKFTGIIYSPITDSWKISPNDLKVNYMVTATHNLQVD